MSAIFHKILGLSTNVKIALFFAFWLAVAGERKIDIFGQISFWNHFLYLLFLIWVAYLTCKTWFQFSQTLAEQTTDIWTYFLSCLIAGLTGVLILLMPLFLMTNSSYESLLSVAIHDYAWENSTFLEQLLWTNIFVIISFSAIKRWTNLVYWVNGNLIFITFFVLYPHQQGPGAGWECNGKWLSEYDGWEGFVCNGNELSYENEISYYDFMRNQWNLDPIGIVFSDLVHMYFSLFVGLIFFGVIHILWRRYKRF